jgi:hypothetical protein
MTHVPRADLLLGGNSRQSMLLAACRARAVASSAAVEAHAVEMVALGLVRDYPTGIPPYITLQLDNTAKQNKGKYLIAFCEILVARKVCEQITINFLPVGHTHEDIDQFFSRIATRCLALP